MRRSLFVLSMLAGFVAVADGVAMMLPGPANSAAGAALVVAGALWLVAGLPRLARPAVRAFVPAQVTMVGVLVVPPLSVPIAGLWLVSSPSALSVWFGVAWAGLWFFFLSMLFVVKCPTCSAPFHRKGSLPRLRPPGACANCGDRPKSPAV